MTITITLTQQEIINACLDWVLTGRSDIVVGTVPVFIRWDPRKPSDRQFEIDLKVELLPPAQGPYR